MPERMALDTVADIAARADVQPSSIVRFAKALGFDGFSDLQRVFQSHLVHRASSYRERIRASDPTARADDGPGVILRRLVDETIASLEHLKSDVRERDLDRAVDLLAGTEAIGVVAQRRPPPSTA